MTDIKKNNELFEMQYVWEILFNDDPSDHIPQIIAESMPKASVLGVSGDYNFLQHTPRNSLISYILVVLFNKGNLSFDGGDPFFRGYENKIDFLQALNFSTEEPYKGYVLLKKCDAMPMLMYNPLYGLQKKNLEELSKQSSSSAKFRIAGVGFEIEKRTETVFDMNGTVVDDTYQGETVDTSHMSSLHDTKYQDVYEFISDIYAIKEFTYSGESFYCLEIEVLSQIESDGSGLRINLYVNKRKLSDYVPQIGDNITGFMWLSAYLSTDNIPEAQDKVYGSGFWAKVKRFLFG